MLHQQISMLLGNAVESEACVYLRARSEADVEQIAVRLRGPHCDFSRTLPAQYVAQSKPGEKGLVEIVVPDPCFWTPQLPFQYEMQATVTNRAGETRQYEQLIGLRRWASDGANLVLERRRTVLRGATCAELSADALAAARQAETALVVSPPSEGRCVQASRLGVPLVVDLRDVGERLDDELARLEWIAAAMIVMLTPAQLRDAVNKTARSKQLLLAQSIGLQNTEDEATALDCDLYAIELSPGERPASWLAATAKPVIAISSAEKYADLASARTACDRLQAEFAPEFNLAGYFV